MTAGYEVLPHTADLRIRAWGKTREELFRNALAGMTSVMSASAPRQPSLAERMIALEAPDTATLLIDFLSAALSQSHVNREVYTDVSFQELGAQSLRVMLRGVSVEAFGKDIKAVTYHGVEIQETDQGYEATVVYDI